MPREIKHQLKKTQRKRNEIVVEVKDLKNDKLKNMVVDLEKEHTITVNMLLRMLCEERKRCVELERLKEDNEKLRHTLKIRETEKTHKGQCRKPCKYRKNGCKKNYTIMKIITGILLCVTKGINFYSSMVPLCLDNSFVCSFDVQLLEECN